MKIYLDIMYSDFWADPTKQNIPAAWAGQDLFQLTSTVRSYTQQVISAFAAQGTPVDMVSIGNEIRNGILSAGEINCASGAGCGGWARTTRPAPAGSWYPRAARRCAPGRSANPRSTLFQSVNGLVRVAVTVLPLSEPTTE